MPILAPYQSLFTHMAELQKILESNATIRFHDCDPYQHLNNAKYINYFIDAREDQVREYYGLDIYKMGKELGFSWMVTQNQIAYLRPALLMEKVVIETQLIRYAEKTVTAEMRMWNESRSELKSFMWSVFIYVNLRSHTSEKHPEHLMLLFREVCSPVEETIFENRFARLSKT